MRVSLVLAITFALAGSAFGQAFAPNDGPFQIGYAANLNIGDSIVNLTNDGINGGVFGATPPTAGNICVNAYVFDPREEEIGCCACLVTPNGLDSLSVKSDLISNNLTPDVPTSVVIKLVASTPASAAGSTALTVCNPATVSALNNTTLTFPFSTIGLTPGMLAWGSTLEPSSIPGTYDAVNVRFQNGSLSGAPPIFITGAGNLPGSGAGSLNQPPEPGSELYGITSVCNFIQANGSGFGLCKSCRLGALGGAKR